MAVDWFLKIEGLPGSSRNSAYRDEMEVLDWLLAPVHHGPPSMRYKPGTIGSGSFSKLYVLRPIIRDAASAFLRTRIDVKQNMFGVGKLTYINWVGGKETPQVVLFLSPVTVRSVDDVFCWDGWKELITVVFFDYRHGAPVPAGANGSIVRQALRRGPPQLISWFVG
jgi:hypothetical protein